MIGKFSFILLFTLCIRANAQELFQTGVIPYGMGGAYSAAADDGLSLYYNPAGLALVHKVEVEVFDIDLGTNSDVVKSYSDMKTLGSSGGLATKLNKLAGKNVEGQAGNNTQITLPGFALAMNYQVNADFNMQNLAYPTTQMQYTKDLDFSTGAAAGFGAKKDFRIGFRFAYMERKGGVETVGLNQILGSKQSLVDLFNQSGTGWGGTLGMQYRLPFEGRTDVTASFVWHDIGKTSFGGFDSKNRPTRINDDMVAGMAIRFPIGGKQNRRMERRYGPQRSSSALTLAYDYTELNQSWNQRQFLLHSHMGMNLDLPILSFQAGMYQSSLSLGTSFDIGIIKVALSTYGEELGSYAGQDRDRRYLLSIGSTFGFSKF